MTERRKLNRLKPVRGYIKLCDCPPGLFVDKQGHFGFKTEYGNNAGRIDAFCLESGEYYWGRPPQTIRSQRATLVAPVELERYRVLVGEFP